jgi:hypothetical protein
MRWTGWVGLLVALLALAGCGYGFQMVGVQARYSTASRPHASYFCYDCHGYRYFDPYYDYCVDYGFRYPWSQYPQVVSIYRDRYVRIREGHPEYGRYRYREDYRATPRYREPRDYDVWRGGPGEKPAVDRARHKREKEEGRPGTKERKGDERKGPRDKGSRLTLPGGTS